MSRLSPCSLVSVVLLFLSGCSGRDGDDTASPFPDSGPRDSGASEPPTGAVMSWELTSLAVGGRTDGFDLDGDGDADNALWLAGAALDPVIAQALAAATVLPVVQLSGVDDTSDDAETALALLAGRPTGAEEGGAPVVDGGATVDAYGVARAATDATLSGGIYVAVLAEGTLTVGSVTLESATGIPLQGTAGSQATEGMLGMALPLEALLQSAVALGLDADAVDTLSALADLDTDGDGVDDAVSAAFVWSGPACVVVAGG